MCAMKTTKRTNKNKLKKKENSRERLMMNDLTYII